MARRKRSPQPVTVKELPSINLPYTAESLRLLLKYGAAKDSPYTHQQIADWAYQFVVDRMEQYDAHLYDVRDDPHLDRAEEIVQDIDAQWDMYSSPLNSSLEAVSDDPDTVQLPQSWFEQWQRELDAPFTD